MLYLSHIIKYDLHFDARCVTLVIKQTWAARLPRALASALRASLQASRDRTIVMHVYRHNDIYICNIIYISCVRWLLEGKCPTLVYIVHFRNDPPLRRRSPVEKNIYWKMSRTAVVDVRAKVLQTVSSTASTMCSYSTWQYLFFLPLCSSSLQMPFSSAQYLGGKRDLSTEKKIQLI